MKNISAIICGCLTLLTLSVHAQGFGHRFRYEDTIHASARDVLRDYLNRESRRRCSGHEKDLPPICSQTKPLYVGSSLPREDVQPLPPEVMHKIGFVEPGTEYAQAGLVVYLISVPRSIILDEVDIQMAR